MSSDNRPDSGKRKHVPSIVLSLLTEAMYRTGHDGMRVDPDTPEWECPDDCLRCRLEAYLEEADPALADSRFAVEEWSECIKCGRPFGRHAGSRWTACSDCRQCQRCHGDLGDAETALGDGVEDCPHCGWDLSRAWTEAAEEYEMWVDSDALGSPHG